MTSSYSTDLKLELMVTGENAGTWGDNTNNNLNLIQQAIAGFEQVTLSSGGTLALAMTDKAISNARNMVIKFATASIAASTICTIPDSIEKFYIFDATGLTNPANLTIKTASGSGFTLDAAKIYAAYSDGTNLKEISLDTLGGTIGTAQIADDAVTTAKIADDAVRAAQISDNAVITAGILNANVTTAKIADDAVTTAKILNDNVTADKLANTAVTAGSYTLSSITVDAQGRLTAAASGAAGGGSMVLTLAANNETGTFAANAQTTNLHVVGMGAGGGCGNQSARPNIGPGGQGAFGYAEVTVSNPYSVPYRAGTGGNSTGEVSGTAGQSSFVGSPADVTFGGGTNGMYPGTGNPGSVSVGPAGTLYANTNPGSMPVMQGLYFGDSATGRGGTRSSSSGGNGGLLIFENIGS